jgi:hypothetical protein
MSTKPDFESIFCAAVHPVATHFHIKTSLSSLDSNKVYNLNYFTHSSLGNGFYLNCDKETAYLISRNHPMVIKFFESCIPMISYELFDAETNGPFSRVHNIRFFVNFTWIQPALNLIIIFQFGETNVFSHRFLHFIDDSCIEKWLVELRKIAYPDNYDRIFAQTKSAIYTKIADIRELEIKTLIKELVPYKSIDQLIEIIKETYVESTLNT